MLTTGMTFGNTLAGEKANHKRQHVVCFHGHEMARAVKAMEAESRLVCVPRAGGWGEWQVTANGFILNK